MHLGGHYDLRCEAYFLVDFLDDFFAVFLAAFLAGAFFLTAILKPPLKT
jgi:hypothetical protein